ncbi:MAG: hypothetical protein QF364_01165 [Candidatus Poseidoniaceae archaeon]|jgi:uncharacterized membrane protein YbjE (DUF340 family)|nr:hypothetical protein [Candidatus Poseidoniaceae archaeon]
MLFGWGLSDWIILIVDIVAVVLIVRFLSWKIKHKLEEVELRQKHALHQKKHQRKDTYSAESTKEDPQK